MRRLTSHAGRNSLTISPKEDLLRGLLVYSRGRVKQLAALMRTRSLLDTDDLIQECHLYDLTHSGASSTRDLQHIANNAKQALVDAIRKEAGRPERHSEGSKRSLRFWCDHVDIEKMLHLADWRSHDLTDHPEAVAKAMALAGLSPQMQHVLYHYFWRDQTLKEIAQGLQVGESRASQIRTEAMQKLKRYLPPKEDLL